MTQKIIVVVSLMALAVRADRPHPYAFERPMTPHQSFFSHKAGIPFVERNGRPVVQGFDEKSVDQDSEQFHDVSAPERDRTSSTSTSASASASAGETEIRSKIFPDFNQNSDRKKDSSMSTSPPTPPTSTTTTKASLEEEFPSNLASLDLMTSHNMPVPMSLKSRHENRQKSQKYESLKPKLKQRENAIKLFCIN